MSNVIDIETLELLSSSDLDSLSPWKRLKRLHKMCSCYVRYGDKSSSEYGAYSAQLSKIESLLKKGQLYLLDITVLLAEPYARSLLKRFKTQKSFKDHYEFHSAPFDPSGIAGFEKFLTSLKDAHAKRRARDYRHRISTELSVI